MAIASYSGARGPCIFIILQPALIVASAFLWRRCGCEAPERGLGGTAGTPQPGEVRLRLRFRDALHCQASTADKVKGGVVQQIESFSFNDIKNE